MALIVIASRMKGKESCTSAMRISTAEGQRSTKPATHRREDAERDRDRERQEQRGAGQEERGGKPLEHEAHRVLPVTQRIAEIAADRACEEARVLHRHRIIEAEALAELIHVLGLDVHRHEEENRIAGEADHGEDRREREEHDESGLGEAGHDVGPHEPTFVSWRYARSRSPDAG